MLRMVIVTVDTIGEILKDYLGEGGIPKNAKVTNLLVNPAEQGKFALVMESPDWKENMPDITADFEVKRYYAV